MIAGHKNIVLLFSGGKDSMACLFLLKDHLSDITVLWSNTGKNYPELLDTVSRAKKLCPNFIEIKTDRDAQWKENGLPSDIVPIDYTKMGQGMTCKKKVMIQSYLQCCWENISSPLVEKYKELGATLIIKGQRADEAHRSISENGYMKDGIQFWHPIEGGTKEQVLDFLRSEMGNLPDHYKLDHSSMDCWDCTAFAEHSHDRAEYMKVYYPVKYKQYQKKLNKVCGAITDTYKQYARLIEE